MRFTEEDLARAKVIIDKLFYAGFIPENELRKLAIVLSEAGIREHGLIVEPSKSVAIRVVEALGYEIR